MLTVNVNANVYVRFVDQESRDQLARIERKVDDLINMGDHLMAANEKVVAFLGQLNSYTNQLAASQAEQTAAIQNIADDLKRLAEGGDLSPEVTEQLEAARASLEGIAAFETAQAETLTNLAAQTADPLPPPVEPVEPPVE